MSTAPATPMGPLLDAAALHARLGDSGTVIVDVRHDLTRPEAGRAAYASGHVPGAFFLHLDEDLSGPQRTPEGVFRGRHPLPDRNALAARLARMGVGPETLLVAYDEADGMFASRMWWLARWQGHARVAVLDGGWQAWRESGYETSSAVPQPNTAASVPPPTTAMTVVDADAVQELLGTGTSKVVDARAPERYRGEVEPLDAKAGHIPGALNRWYKRNLDAAGRFKSPGVLRQEYEALLGYAPQGVVHQCGSGVSACHNLLAMAVAGLPEGALYPGSWSEWSADETRPVATGPMP